MSLRPVQPLVSPMESDRFPTLTLLQSRGMFLPVKQTLFLDDWAVDGKPVVLEFANAYLKVQWQHVALTQVHRNILDAMCSYMQPIYRAQGEVVFEFSLYELYSYLMPPSTRNASNKKFHLSNTDDLRQRLDELKTARFRVEDLVNQKVYSGRVGLSTGGENPLERYGQTRERFRLSPRFTEFWRHDVHVDLRKVLHHILALKSCTSQALARSVLSNKFKSGQPLLKEFQDLGVVYAGLSRSAISNLVRQVKDDADGLSKLGIELRKTPTGELGVFYEKLDAVRWQNGVNNRVQLPLLDMPEGMPIAPLEGEVRPREFFKRESRRSQGS